MYSARADRVANAYCNRRAGANSSSDPDCYYDSNTYCRTYTYTDANRGADANSIRAADAHTHANL